jgi:hypothetical protein
MIGSVIGLIGQAYNLTLAHRRAKDNAFVMPGALHETENPF